MKKGVDSKSLERGADLDKPQVERVPGGRVIAEKGPRTPPPIRLTSLYRPNFKEYLATHTLV